MELEYELSSINGIGDITKKKLIEAGITGVKQLASLTVERLANLNGFGLATSKKIIESAQEFIRNNKNSEKKSQSSEPVQEDQKKPIVEAISDDKDQNVTLNYLSILEQEDMLEEPFQDENGDQIEEFESTKHSLNIDDKHFFITDQDNMDKELEDFVEQLYQKQQYKKSFQDASIPYEEEEFDSLNGEKLSKEELFQLKKATVQHFESAGYLIIDKHSTLLREISKEIDMLAYKILDINDSVGAFVLFPVKLSHLRGVLLISEEHIIYKPTNMSVEIAKDALVSAQKEIFRNITHGGSLFHLLHKKLANRQLVIRKTRNGSPLFMATNKKEYKPVIHPVLVSLQEAAFLEKTILFPYQRNINLHIVESKAIKALVKFLERKVKTQENLLQGNAIVQYDTSINKMIGTYQKYSIPFLLFGIVFGLIMFLQNIFVTAAFNNLGIAILVMYGFFLAFVFNKFKKTQKTIKQNFATPYYRRRVQIDEIDLYSIKDITSSHELDQAIYEWFGKNCKLACLSEIESQKFIEDQEVLEKFGFPLRDKGKNVEKYQYAQGQIDDEQADVKISKDQSLKRQLISKYITFLED